MPAGDATSEVDSALDPELIAAGRLFARLGIAPVDILTTPVHEARLRVRAYQAVCNADPPPLASVFERWTDDGMVRVRLYHPASAPVLPCYIHLHGGGFALGDLDTSDRFLRLIAAESGIVVCGVDYALAPEARFPVQLEQVLRVVGWIAASGQEFGVDTARLAIGGDSAGANLALSAMLALRDGHVDLMRQGVLVYPMLSPAAETESHALFGDGRFGLSTARLDWFWRSYVDTAAMLTDPRVAPLAADFTGLPPQLIVAAALDPLRDDANLLAEKLAEAGIAHQMSLYQQLPHGFVQLTRFVTAARAAASEVAETLKTSLAVG